MNDLLPTPSRMLRTYATAAKWALGLLVALWLILMLAWGALHGFIVPRIGELRPELETEVGRVLGVPVRIGNVVARSEGLVPSFEFSDVVLLDPQGRPALRLPRVVAALSPRSLWNLGFEQLHIDQPELDIRRAADGKVYVAGLDFSQSSDNDGRAADWFFSQTEFVIRGGAIRWTDEKRGAPALTLEKVDFVMRNGPRRHAMRLDATPPADWGDRFTVQGQFRQPLLSRRHGRWQDWEGQLHGDFARVDVSQLRRYADLGFEVSQGQGALRAWVDVSRGLLMGGVADLSLVNVNTRLGKQLTPLALQSVSGRLGGKRLEGGFEFQTQNLQFTTLEGQRWPGGNVFVQWMDAQGNSPARGEIRADKLDLFAVSQIATRLPLGEATHAALLAYAPKGLVETVQAKWQGPLSALEKYEAKGRAVGLEVSARPASAAAPAASAASGAGPATAHAGTPGVRGAALDFDVTQTGGKGRLLVRSGAIDVPGVFEDPVIPFDELAADLLWQIDGEAIKVDVTNLKFTNADAQGDGQIHWRTGKSAQGRFPGVLDLQAGISRANGARVYRYLPFGVSKAARDYVRESISKGWAGNAKFRVKGDLHDFPFRDPKQGEFSIRADVKDVTYAFVPPVPGKPGPSWPALTQLSGELVFLGNGMQVKNAQGRFTGAPGLAVKTDATIADFKGATVMVNGDIRGPLAQSLAIVNGSPISALVNQSLAKATATGNADVKLKLELPIATIDKSKVSGSVTLANNDIQITPDSPVLSRARGTVAFNEHGFTLTGAQARALGGDVKLDGGSRNVAAGSTEPTITMRAQGTATAEGLRAAKELGFVSRLAKDFTGSAAYNMVLTFRAGLPEISVTTNLQGVAVNLPSPFNKPADTVLPLRYENLLVRESLATPGKLQDQLSIELGRLASVNYVRDVSGPEPKVLRGSIAVGLAQGESAPLPAEGVVANINLASVNLDAWERALAQATAGGGAAATSTSLRASGGGAAAAYLPTTLAVRAREMTVEGRVLRNVVVGGSREGPVWRANVDANELNGYIEYRQPSGPGGGRLHARLARLVIAASEAKQVEALLDEQPDVLPALDIVVDDFELRGKKLGKLEIEAVNRGASAGNMREWRLNKLNLTLPEAVFSATGNWVALSAQTADRRRTSMKFRLEIADSGQLLTRFGMKDVVRRGKGRMEGQVGWVGSPLALNYPTMDGSFYVNMESGQFLKADPGLAKLLGVLSLQSLPRRLALDFRDVFSEGFAFDFVRGDVTVEDGIAATNNLQMKGVNAAVLMDGRADIARETQDIKVVVVPEINAGTASLVATVINPALGLGSFLAQMFLRQPLIRAATQEFHIDGTWSDPRITKVDKRSEAAVTPPAEAPKPAGN
ncbi:YhdP family protein [Caenimonas sp. SL110]|uniref:YhdP family protein n=1 Tax=Caenimonas sp. SL110 TaxID=1450524 RepID=UPI000653A360|nr:YhdP family protein [Caenimonas sp. SL110]